MRKAILLLMGIVLAAASLVFAPAEASWRAFNCSIVTDVPQNECEVLVTLFNSTNGKGWVESQGWLASSNVSDWHGIEVEQGHIIRVWLGNNNLNGQIPTELENLSELKFLDFSRNKLYGEIPAELGNLSNLEFLGLGFNDLSGQIPASLWNLTKLTGLGLGNNYNLTGQIPPELGNLKNLETLLIFDTQVSGEIPAEIGQLTKLTGIHTHNNQLSGSIPASIKNLVNLEAWFLGMNQLSGPIPSELGDLTKLKLLTLDQNQLSDDIPESLVKLVNLCTPDSPYDGICDGLSYGLVLNYNRLNTEGLSQALEAFLVEKSPGWKVTQSKSAIIDDAGGPIVNNEIIEILVPEGTMAGDTEFSFIPQSELSEHTGGLSFAGNAFQLTATDVLSGDPVTVFNPPLTVEIRYDQADLGNIGEDSLALYYWDKDTDFWEDVVTTCPDGEYTRNLVDNWFSVSICHLSEFVVLGEERFETFLPFIMY